MEFFSKYFDMDSNWVDKAGKDYNFDKVDRLCFTFNCLNKFSNNFILKNIYISKRFFDNYFMKRFILFIDRCLVIFSHLMKNSFFNSKILNNISKMKGLFLLILIFLFIYFLFKLV